MQIHPTSPPDGLRRAAPLRASAQAAVWCAAVVSHLPALRNGLPLDDAVILANPAIASLKTLPVALSSPWWYSTKRLYRPLTLLTYAVERAVGSPLMVTHGVNLALHGVVAVLVGRLIARFLPAREALAGALLFAVLPGHAEAVATMVGRAELLAALWMLLLMLLVTRDAPATPRDRMLAALLAALALASKEGGVAAPALAYGAAWTCRAQRRHAMRWAASAAVGTTALLTARLGVLGTMGGDLPNPVFRILGAGERVLVALAILPRTVATLLLPLPPPIDFVPTLAELRAPQPIAVLAGAALVAGMVWLMMQHLRRPSAAGLGAWIAAACAAPTVNLLFASGVVLSGRTLYAPTLGAALLAAAAAAALAKRSARRATRSAYGVAVAGLLLWCAALSWRESAVWRSTDSAIAAMQARHPGDYRSFLHLAYTARDHGRDREAVTHFRAAADRFAGDPEMLTDGATVALRLRDTATARAWLESAIAVSPRAARARTRLYGVLLARGDSAGARRLLVEGLSQEPGQRTWLALLRELDRGDAAAR